MRQIFRILLFDILLCSVSSCHVVNQSQPKIVGISSTSLTGERVSDNRYIQSVIAAGGTPILIPIMTDTSKLSAILDKIDALIITGGEDIQPSLYGEKDNARLETTFPQRDTFDYYLIKAGVRKGLRILGVCRGMQMMNVVFGGTLYQDLYTMRPGSMEHRQKEDANVGVQTITIDTNSILYDCIGRSRVEVNTYHHQAIKDLSPMFRITATTSDGVVESIQMKNSEKILGVQFHPEGFVSAGDTLFTGIFRRLLQ
jgi:putative glutamine amidotransferase